MGQVGTFYVPTTKARRYAVSGVTRDAGGNVLGGCHALVFESIAADAYRFVGDTVSDATLGTYSVDVPGPDTGQTFFVVWYKAGSPDVAGTSVNTLKGVEV